ncbi:MAG: type I 3-dehydroquinate dehydratase [Clostridia bacterium]|nr:type I 3-dehydroquinate dehydratase [Clostridia bacterium]
MKPTFLTYQKPLLCAMVQDSTPEDMICTIMNSHYDGAEAFGIQLENLLPEYRTLPELKKIFSYCRNKPIYLTSYRSQKSKGLTDDECADLLLLGLEAGGTLCDVMGDFYHKEPNELTFDPEAVAKQEALIKKIHDMGGEVLMSTHIHDFFDEEKTLKIALEQKRRGADVVKIVNFARTEDEMMSNLNTIHRIKKELDGTPFLYLANGAECRLIRQIGARLGVCMYLCVQNYLPVSSKEQPLLRSMKIARDNMVE